MNCSFLPLGSHHAIPVSLVRSFLQSLIVPRFQDTLFCRVLTLGIFAFALACSPELPAQMMPTPRLQVIQPNGGEFLQSGRDYLIRWTGIDSTIRVRLEYSIDAGRSWRLITDTAHGGSYLWQNVPNTPSDSCLLQAIGTAGDSTVPVGRTMVSFQVPQSKNPAYPDSYYGTESARFSPDGTKILVTNFSEPMYQNLSWYNWKKQNTEVRDAKTGAGLYTLPPYVRDTAYASRVYGWGGYYGYGYGGWGGASQTRWHPDNTRLLSQLTDTTFGIFDAQTGMLQRTISVPTRGNQSQITALQWTSGGAEVLATVNHRFFSAAASNGYYDTNRVTMVRINAATGALSNTPLELGQYVWGSTTTRNCSWGWGGWGAGWGGMQGVSNDGERMLSVLYDSISCAFRGYVIRSTRTGAIMQTLMTSSTTSYWWGGYGWGGGANNLWSPNDSLLVMVENWGIGQQPELVFVSTHTGLPVQRVRFPYTSGSWNNGSQWSPDSKRFFVDGYIQAPPTGSPIRFIINVESGTIAPTIRNIQNWWTNNIQGDYGNTVLGTYSWGYSWWGGNNGRHWGQNASCTAWSPDSRYIVGFVYQNRSTRFWSRNPTNTVGIWNAATGCLLQTFRLPFPDDTDSPERRTFLYSNIQWSADGKRLLLYSPMRFFNRQPVQNVPDAYSYRNASYDGTALIASVNVDDIACQEDVSDSLWTILPRGSLRIENVAFPSLRCGATSHTITASIANFGTKRVNVVLPTISGANADDFTLVTSSNTRIIATTAGNVEVISIGESGGRSEFTVRFEPRGFGDRSAMMTFADTNGFVIETITLTGRKDTLALAAAGSMSPDIRTQLGRILQFTTTSASVRFRNTGTLPLTLTAQPQQQGGGQTIPLPILVADTANTTNPQAGGGMGSGGGGVSGGGVSGVSGGAGNQQWRSIGGKFVVDSIAPRVVAAGAEAVLYLTFIDTGKEGAVKDSVELLECAGMRHLLAVEGRIVPNEPRLEMDTVLNFGNLLCKSSSTATIVFRNEGGKQLYINTIPFGDTPVFRAVSPSQSLVIPPFDSLAFTVNFIPLESGLAESYFFVDSDDPRRLRKVVNLRGRTTLYRYEWSTQTVNFGAVPFGRGAARTLTLTNTGGATFVAPQLPRNLDGVFVWEDMQPRVIQPNSTATVTMRFLGRREQGNFGANLDIPMNDLCQTTTRLDFAAVVLGPEPRITVQDSLRLPTLYCETSSVGTISYMNEGDAELRINRMTWEGADSVHFPRASFQLGSTTLGAQQTSVITFRYEPRSPGEHRVTLVLNTNDTTRNASGDVRILIRARKDFVGISSSINVLPFSTVLENTTLRDTILLTNTGTVPLVWRTPLNNNANEVVNVAIDSTFIVESIEPSITSPNQVSRLIVRFRGNQAGFSATRMIPLEAASPLAGTSCVRTTTLTLSAEVRKEPRLAAVEGASARLLCETATTFTIRLASIGTDDVLVESVELLNNPNNIFRITRRPSLIPARSGRDSIVVAAETAQMGMVFTGPFTAQIGIRSNAVNMPDTSVTLTLRKDSSGLQAVPSSIDFASLPANTSAERIITLRNTGTIPQGFTLPLTVGAFRLDSLGTNPISPNAETQARVRFVGSTGGVVRDTLRLHDSCNRIVALPLQARVIAGVAVLPDTVAIQVGETAEIPLLLTKRNGVEAGMEATFSLRVENASLLEVLAPAPSKPTEFVRITAPIPTVAQILTFQTHIPSIQETEPLLRLQVRSLIGNATTTTFRLQNVQISTVAVQSAPPSLYRTRGINYAGGSPRLVFSPNIMALALAPNPVGEELRLSLTLQKTAPLSVEMTDMLGKKHLLTERSVDAGSTDVRISTAAVPSGVYAVLVRVGNEAVSRLVTIVR